MTALVYAALIAVNSCFWFTLAVTVAHGDGQPSWMPFAILALVTVPAALGVGLGWALKEQKR